MFPPCLFLYLFVDRYSSNPMYKRNVLKTIELLRVPDFFCLQANRFSHAVS